MDLLEKAVEIMLNFGSKEWQTKFCELPGLMNEELLAQLDTRTSEMPAEIRERVTGFITVARHIEEQMRTVPAGYPLGSGPLEQILLNIKEGHVGMEVAIQQACEMAQNKELHTSYLRALSFRCVQLSYQGKAEDALSMQFLIREAAGLMPDDSQHAIRAKLAVELIRSAAWILHEKGDASIFHRALLAGEQELSRAVTADEKAELNYGLGILHLDPYAANRPPGWHTTQIRQWFAAGNNPPGCKLGGADGLPQPEDALAKAESYLRLACHLGAGEIRRDSLKALIQTLESGRMVDLVPDEEELISLCDEALELLARIPNPEQRAYITEVRNQAASN